MEKIQVSWPILAAGALLAGFLGAYITYVGTPREDVTQILESCVKRDNCVIKRYLYVTNSPGTKSDEDDGPLAKLIQKEHKFDKQGKVQEVQICTPFEMPEFVHPPELPEVPEPTKDNRDEVEDLLMGFIEAVLNNEAHNKTLLNKAYLDYRSKCRIPPDPKVGTTPPTPPADLFNPIAPHPAQSSPTK